MHHTEPNPDFLGCFSTGHRVADQAARWALLGPVNGMGREILKHLEKSMGRKKQKTWYRSTGASRATSQMLVSQHLLIDFELWCTADGVLVCVWRS